LQKITSILVTGKTSHFHFHFIVYLISRSCVGQLAEGNYNFTSGVESLQDELVRQIGNTHEIVDKEEVERMEGDDTEVHMLEDDDIEMHRSKDDDESGQRNRHMLRRTDNLSREEAVQAASAEPSIQQKRPVGVPKEPKKAKKGATIESLMERYLEMRTKQAEDESAQIAREEGAQGANFSITRCVSILNTMDVTKAEKAKKAYVVFKRQENIKNLYAMQNHIPGFQLKNIEV
jgi:hypothetical protein